MKVRKEYIILTVLIVGLSLYLILHSRDRTQYDLPVLQEVPMPEITKIEISKPGGSTVTLERKEDQWIILPEAYLAEAGKISVMLESIGTLFLTALVSESKSYERYGLSKEEKIGVKAWSGDGLKRDFEVGKTASSFQHTFVKIAGDDRVFHARENLKSRFDQTTNTLRDKTVLRFEPSEVESMELSDGKKTLGILRKPVPVEIGASQDKDPASSQAQEVWESPEGKVDESKVTQLLGELSKLKCGDYIHDKKKSDFNEPVYTIKLKGRGEHALSFFAKDEKNKNDYPAVSSQSDSPFLLPDNQATRLMLPPDQILK
jgi:Domain of unknown function (DUF4340)